MAKRRIPHCAQGDNVALCRTRYRHRRGDREMLSTLYPDRVSGHPETDQPPDARRSDVYAAMDKRGGSQNSPADCFPAERHQKDPQDPGMAGAPSALAYAFHADLGSGAFIAPSSPPTTRIQSQLRSGVRRRHSRLCTAILPGTPCDKLWIGMMRRGKSQRITTVRQQTAIGNPQTRICDAPRPSRHLFQVEQVPLTR